MPTIVSRMLLPLSLGFVAAGACADSTPATLNQKCFHDEDCDDGEFCERTQGAPDGLCRKGMGMAESSGDGLTPTTGGPQTSTGPTPTATTEESTGSAITDSQGTSQGTTDSGDSVGSTSGSSSGSTGGEPECGDASVDEGELCFGDPITVVTESTIRGVDVADLDGDGHIDIVAVYHPGNGLGAARVALGDGDGSFAVAEEVDLGVGGYERVALAALGDFDVDLCAVDTLQNEVSCVRGDGNGGFGAPSTHNGGTFDLLLVDLDDNGALDLINDGGEFLQGFVGSGGETFGTSPDWLEEDNVGFPILGMAHADLGDVGTPDIVIATPNQSRVRVLHTDGGPGNPFTTPTILQLPGEAPVDVAIGDFDGDGDLDLVAVVGGGVRVWLNANGNGVDFDPVTAHEVDAGTVGVKTGDFNNDGLDDIVTANTSGTLSVVLSVDGTVFDDQVAIAIPGTPYDLAVADLNEDGSDDIVIAAGTGARVLLSNP